MLRYRLGSDCSSLPPHQENRPAAARLDSAPILTFHQAFPGFFALGAVRLIASPRCTIGRSPNGFHR
jgi:hypothetical protein